MYHTPMCAACYSDANQAKYAHALLKKYGLSLPVVETQACHDAPLPRLTSLYHTPNIAVLYTCIANPYANIVMQTSLYRAPDITLSWYSLLYHTPDKTVSYITVSCTRHHRIVHQTTLYHTPDITLSYTSLHCIIHTQHCIIA